MPTPLLQTLLLPLLLLTAFSSARELQAASPPNDTVVATDSFQTQGSADAVPEDDLEPHLAIFALFLIGFALICIATGLVVSTTILLILMGLIASGILSISILVALHKKSFQRGFKMLVLLSAIVGSLGIALIAGYLFYHQYHSGYTLGTVMAFAAIAGMAAGWILGYLTNLDLFRLTAYWKERLSSK